ncbi:Crp/Fnr family transcriptional regulator [Chitinophagaceae bacterium MMS25-I14]
MSSGIDALKAFIQRTSSVPGAVADSIAGNFEQVHIRKNDFILKAGRVCNSYIFLEKGFARAYTIDAEGNEVTTAFCGENAIIVEVASFFKKVPARENICALTDCEGWQLSFEQLNTLFHEMPEFREFGRTVLVNVLTTLKERMLSMINYTAEQRYAQLLETNPEVFRYAPLKQIATYLGITDTSLSRIRKERMHK